MSGMLHNSIALPIWVANKRVCVHPKRLLCRDEYVLVLLRTQLRTRKPATKIAKSRVDFLEE